MRIISVTAIATLAISLVAAVVPNPAAPRPAADVIAARQVKRKEIEAKQKYPEIFEYRKRDDPSGLPAECDFPTKRSILHEPRFDDDVNVMTPREIADFLVNRGVYVATNGTRLIDRSFLEGLERGEAIIAKRSRWRRALSNAVSNGLVSIAMPVYRQWKERSLNGNDATFHLSETTAFHVRDIPLIERALLNHPDFTETQVLGYRITRRFIEAANALN